MRENDWEDQTYLEEGELPQDPWREYYEEEARNAVAENRVGLGQTHDISSVEEWQELSKQAQLVPARCLLATKELEMRLRFTECVRSFNDKALCVTAPPSVVATITKLGTQDTDLVCLLKGEFLVQTQEVRTEADWCSVEESLYHLICDHACLVVIGYSSNPNEQQIFDQDIALAFEKYASISGSEVRKVRGEAQAKMYENLQEVVARTMQGKWSHLMFSVDPSKAELTEHIKYALRNPFAGWLDIIFCGHGALGSGDWFLWDDDFTSADMSNVLKKVLEERENSPLGKQVEITGSIILNCCYGGKWFWKMLQDKGLEKYYALSRMRLQGNSEEIPIGGMFQLDIQDSTGLSRVLPTSETLKKLNRPPAPSDALRVLPSEPTVVVFPAQQGDCSLFTDGDGYTLLVDGGRCAALCFWEYIRTLSKVDDIVGTHLDQDHITGIGGLLQLLKEREGKSTVGLHGCADARDSIGEFYLNCPYNYGAIPIDLPATFNQIMFDAQRSVSEGAGTLLAWRALNQSAVGGEAFPKKCVTGTIVAQRDRALVRAVTPYIDTLGDPKTLRGESKKQAKAEANMEIFLKDWKMKTKSNLKTGVGNRTVTMTNMVSVSLLVSTLSEEHHYVFYTGDAPQNRLLTGLEKVLGADFTQNGLDVDVLYVPHHASAKNTNKDFYLKVRASYYIFSSNGDMHGHPDREVIENVLTAIQEWTTQQRGRHPDIRLLPTYRTDKNEEQWKNLTLPDARVTVLPPVYPAGYLEISCTGM